MTTFFGSAGLSDSLVRKTGTDWERRRLIIPAVKSLSMVASSSGTGDTKYGNGSWSIISNVLADLSARREGHECRLLSE